MDVADSLLDLVGNTPLVRLGRVGRDLECDLLAKVDGNDRLGDLLQEILRNADTQKLLGAELGLESSSGEAPETSEETPAKEA